MTRVLFCAVVFAIPALSFGQLKEGKIVYERTMQLQISFAGDNPAFANMIPRERKDRFELLFANNQTLWRSVPEVNEGDDMAWNSGGAEIRMVVSGQNDVTFSNLQEMKRVEERELGGKKYIVNDSIIRLDWKLSDETKEILGYKCRKATARRIQPSVRMNNDNGKISREEVTDTLSIVAWFAPEIPVFAGPLTYQGQLPGAILEINENDGRSTIRAVEISAKADVKEIKEPKSGKKVTAEEFRKEREKLFKEMQERGGGNMRIRMGN